MKWLVLVIAGVCACASSTEGQDAGPDATPSGWCWADPATENLGCYAGETGRENCEAERMEHPGTRPCFPDPSASP